MTQTIVGFFTSFQLSGGGKSSQDLIEELASDILTKIPPDFNLEEVQVSTSLRYRMIFLTLSIFKISRLISCDVFTKSDVVATCFCCLIEIRYHPYEYQQHRFM